MGLIFSKRILLFLNTPPEILPEAVIYLNIMFFGMILLFGYNATSTIVRGLGDSKTPLYFLIIASVVNIILDLLFILVFKWGIAGAAWATIIAEDCTFDFGLNYL
ncbi:MAG: polysaccharide biosynthesis C-terminal domain-containing protein [Clostridiaceae bacterium]|nr:polysaccharide biosynthesis C-terminal domain-containing protein [Clostridiaceae bacterium]